MKFDEKSVAEIQNDIESLKEKLRQGQRDLRKAKKKQDQRRNYIVGEIVIKHFPELKEIIPGMNKEENDEKFDWFDKFLQSVAEDEQFKGIYYKSKHKKEE